MNPLRKPITLTILAILCCFLAHAQQYSVLQSNIDIKGPKHDILHCTDGGLITITYPFTDDKDPVTVTRFDAKAENTGALSGSPVKVRSCRVP